MPEPSRNPSVLRHPADRGREDERGAFDRFAERASFFAGSPVFFLASGALILVWAVGLVAGASVRFEEACAALMSALTLILVAALKNAELRADRAIQLKLDAIAASLLDHTRGNPGDSAGDLEDAIGVHEQI